MRKNRANWISRVGSLHGKAMINTNGFANANLQKDLFAWKKSKRLWYARVTKSGIAENHGL